MPHPLVFTIVLNYKSPHLTLGCVRSILDCGYPNLRVVVVDNASGDESLEVFRRGLAAGSVDLLGNAVNEGYAGGNNRGIDYALAGGADYIFVLNNDTVVHEGCIAPLIVAMEADHQLGVAGCPIYEVGKGVGLKQGEEIDFKTGEVARRRQVVPVPRTTEVDFICGAAIMLRASMVRAIGGFDPGLFLLYEDADICFRARAAGYRVSFVPSPGITHYASVSTKRALPMATYFGMRNRAWFVRRHGSLRQRLLFNVCAFLYLYPKAILGRLVGREWTLIAPTVKGMWQGHWGYQGYQRPDVGEAGRPSSRRSLGR